MAKPSAKKVNPTKQKRKEEKRAAKRKEKVEKYIKEVKDKHESIKTEKKIDRDARLFAEQQAKLKEEKANRKNKKLKKTAVVPEEKPRKRRRLSDPTEPRSSKVAKAWLKIQAPLFDGKLKREERGELQSWITKVLEWLKFDHNRFGHKYTLTLIRMVEPDWKPDPDKREVMVTGSQVFQNITNAIRKTLGEADALEDDAMPPSREEEAIV